MTRRITIKAKPGFDWRLVAWGAPDSPRRPLCSYCHGRIDEDDVPLMLFKDDGSLAQFCDKCIERWFA